MSIFLNFNLDNPPSVSITLIQGSLATPDWSKLTPLLLIDKTLRYMTETHDWMRTTLVYQLSTIFKLTNVLHTAKIFLWRMDCKLSYLQPFYFPQRFITVNSMSPRPPPSQVDSLFSPEPKKYGRGHVAYRPILKWAIDWKFCCHL